MDFLKSTGRMPKCLLSRRGQAYAVVGARKLACALAARIPLAAQGFFLKAWGTLAIEATCRHECHDLNFIKETPMWSTAKHNFILQQGFGNPAPGSCSLQYSALQFQPRVVLIWIIAGILFQTPSVFATLSAILWWSALLPKLNPFDALYNRVYGKQPSGFRVSPAPPPRRTSQGIAGTFSLACALLIYFGFNLLAYVIEGVFLAAVMALTIGGFCLGSFAYHLFRGRGEFARRTLPWAGTPPT